MLEDHLYWTMVWFRWIDRDNFAKGPAHFADGAPEPAREELRRKMYESRVADLHSQGIGRHDPAQVAELGGRSLQALATLLGDQPHLLGERASAVDAFAFALLASILTPFFDSPLRRAAQGHANLVAYTARMMRRHYPGQAWEAA